MVAILNYVLLGIILYIVIIPIMEELTTVIVQGLEVLKGSFVVKIATLQDQAEELANKKIKTNSHAIGFSIPSDDDYEEEDDEDD